MFDIDDGSGSDFGGAVVSLATLRAYNSHTDHRAEAQGKSSQETSDGETCRREEGCNDQSQTGTEAKIYYP